METLLKSRTGAPGDHNYSQDKLAVYESFGLQEDSVEKLTASRIRQLTPAEDPDQLSSWEQTRVDTHAGMFAALDDDDLDDDEDDDDPDEELVEVDLEDDEVEDVADDEIDEDVDLDLDDDDDDDDDDLV